MRYRRTVRVSHTLFDGPQRLESDFLRVRQALHKAHIHALIWSFGDKRMQEDSGLSIPELDRAIIAATGKHHAIGAECKPAYPVGMSPQYHKKLVCISSPHPDGLIVATTGKHLTSGTKSKSAYPTSVAL